MGSPCLFTRRQAFNMWSFYWLWVKNSNYLHAEFSLGYLGDTKFYLESKAWFIDISGIASFKLFLIAWLREYCTFSDSSVVSLKSSPWPKYTQLGTIFQTKSCSTIKLFSSSNMFFIILFLANTWRKKKRKGEFISPSSLWFEGNLLRFVHARAHMREVMTRKSCVVEMPNGIVGKFLYTRDIRSS